MNASYVDKLSTGNNENVKWKSFSAFLFNKIRFSGLKNVRCRFGNQISAARKFQREQRFANTKADEMLFHDFDRASRIIFLLCVSLRKIHVEMALIGLWCLNFGCASNFSFRRTSVFLISRETRARLGRRLFLRTLTGK